MCCHLTESESLCVAEAAELLQQAHVVTSAVCHNAAYAACTRSTEQLRGEPVLLGHHTCRRVPERRIRRVKWSTLQ